MEIAKDQIVLIIKNNLGLPAKVSLMGNSTYPNTAQVNAQSYFYWELATEDFVDCVSFSIEVGTSPGVFQTVTVPFTSGTYNSLATALSGLGYGFFFASGSTIYTYNKTLYFGDLTIN